LIRNQTYKFVLKKNHFIYKNGDKIIAPLNNEYNNIRKAIIILNKIIKQKTDRQLFKICFAFLYKE
jgi:hypothetical protein